MIAAAFEALTAGETSAAPWYQSVAGVLAIPAAMLGIVGSWVVVRRSSLEYRKLDLECQKLALEVPQGPPQAVDDSALSAPKELRDASGAPAQAVSTVGHAALDLLIVQEVILRFGAVVILQAIWGFVLTGYGWLIAGFKLAFALGGADNWPGWAQVIAVVILRILEAAPQAIYWILVIGLIWPVAFVIADHLRIRVPRLLRHSWSLRVVVLVVTLVVAFRSVLSQATGSDF